MTYETPNYKKNWRSRRVNNKQRARGFGLTEKMFYYYHKITKAVEESADGVTSAAMSVDALVADMNDVNKEMETNQSVSDMLRKETECFVEL